MQAIPFTEREGLSVQHPVFCGILRSRTGGGEEIAEVMKKAVLFDLDGTLTDPGIGITSSVQFALRAYGIEEPDLSRLYPFIGPPLTDSFQEFYGFSLQDAKDAVQKYREYFSVTGLFENEVYAGIPGMLETLCRRGLILAVATSKPEVYAERILEHFDLKKYFTVIGGADMEETRVKKGDVIAYTLERLEKETGAACTKERVMMVGDRLHDVCGAAEQELPCIGVLYGYGSEKELMQAGALCLAESVEELERLLCKWGEGEAI